MASTVLNGLFIFKENSKSTVICKYCSKVFKYHRSLSSIQNHIKNKHTFYPKLAILAEKYLGTPATTVPCERLFSIAGFIADKRRSALLPESLNVLLCLKDWLVEELD